MTNFVNKWQQHSANKWLIVSLRLVIGLVFILAGLSKATAPVEEFIELTRQWNILPDPWLTIYVISLPWVELLAGIGLLTGLLTRGSATLIALMLLSFLIAIGVNMARGTSLENCGCFGGWFELGETFQALLWRDALMLLGTAWIILMPKPVWLSLDAWLTKK